MLLNRILLFGLLGLVITFSACEEEDTPDPTTINFSSPNYIISEEIEQGLIISIDFDLPVEIPGSVSILFEGGTAVYNVDYTTEPALNNNQINFDLTQGQESAQFIIRPIDNDEFQGVRTVQFGMTNAEGVLLGDLTQSFLSITDNDPQTTPVVDIIATFDGSPATIVTETFLRGIITSTEDGMDESSLFMQDNTGGVVILFSENHPYQQGGRLMINAIGAVKEVRNSTLFISNVNLANSVLMESNVPLPAPENVAVQDLINGNQLGKRVQLENVFFEEADGIRTLEGFSRITDGNEAMWVKVEPHASFAQDLIPLGYGSITGIAFKEDGRTMVLMQSVNDLFDNDPQSFINVESSQLTDFGEVQTGMMSASQVVTLSGINLVENVRITSSTSFRISTDNVNFTNALDIHYQTLNNGSTNIYIQFAPISNESGTRIGRIEYTSQQAATVILEPTGTEIGQ